MIKPGSNDIKVNIKLEIDELELLQENTWQMTESFGLDRRINSFTGNRKASFYMWDLECLKMVVDDLKKTEKEKKLVERLSKKIKSAIDFIDNPRDK